MNYHTPRSGSNKKHFRTPAICCATLIFALGSSIAQAQYSYPSTDGSPLSGYAQGNYPYTQPTPQYQAAAQPNTQYRVASDPTTQQTVTPYQTTPYSYTQPSATPYRTAQLNNTTPPASSMPSNVYPATGSYPQSGTLYPSTNQVEPARYIQPSLQPLTSGARQPFLSPATSPANAAPYNTPPQPNDSTTSTVSIEGQTIVDVRIVGNRQTTKERIASMIRTRKGREFHQEVVQRDIREMSRSGLFVNVKPSYQETPEGPIVIFEVVERPILESIKFVGARSIKRKTLLKESGLKEGDAADPFKVEEARKSLEYYYHDKGYAQARVTIHEGNKPGDRQAIFIINEGSKQKILWTKFIGNAVATDARLKTQIESKEGIFWFINGEFNYERLEEDTKKLQAYYRGLGYFDAKIGSEVSFTFDNWAMVTFVINEGPRYKVRNTRFLGNKIFTEEQLRKDLQLLPDHYFNQNKMNADISATRERYGRVGYVFADIKAEPRFLEEPGTLDMVYSVKEGQQHAIGRVIIKIKGNGEVPRTKKTVILDNLTQGPGDIIDIKKIRDSERMLRASEVFATNPATGMVPKILISPPEEPEDPYLRGSYGEDSSDRPPQTRGQNW